MKKNTTDKDTRTAPVGLLITGKDFKRACEILSEKCPDKHPSLPNTDLYKIRLYLIGHAFELLFKSILLHAGIAVAELKSAYGHDIIRLMEQVEKLAIFPLDEKEKQLLRFLNDYYVEKDLEYHVRGYKEYPRVNELILLSGRLFHEVEKWLRRNSSRVVVNKV